MKNKIGFTILEILAVIVIIATVTAIAVPSIFKITNKARERLYCSKLEIVQKSAERYADDNNLANICSIDNIEYDCESITIQDLINGNYIDSDGLDGAFLDPRNNTSLNTKEVLVYEKDSRSYAYIGDSACPSLVTSALSPDELNNVKHSLTVNTDGGTWSGTSPVTLREGQTLFVNDPVKAGCDFIRWTVTGNDSDINDNIFTMGLEDSTLTATWDVLGYTLTVVTDGGTWSGTTPQILDLNDTVTISAPTKANYVFTGWTINGTGAFTDKTTFKIGDGDVTLTANWVTYQNMYTYTGSSQFVDGGNGTWKIKFLTSGTFTYNGYNDLTIDTFLVGGGGKGTGCWSDVASGFGGGGGLTITQSSFVIAKGVSYPIVVGTGATTTGALTIRGGTSSAFGFWAIGGQSGLYADAGDGGSGGSDRGNAGGTNGSNGGTAGYTLGYGQGTTTREFGETLGDLYSNAGSGDGYSGSSSAPRVNSGDGSNGYCSSQYNGAAGIVIIRNHYPVGSEVYPDAEIVDYTYTGNSILINDGGGNWRIKFLTSGTFTYNGTGMLTLDAFAVGGGGKGTGCWSDVASGFGGGGGLTTTQSSIVIAKGVSYPIVVGAGATTNGSISIRGGTTSAFGVSAIGGQSGWYGGDGSGGSGGSDRGNAGGTNGSNGITVAWILGIGQGTTTREFGESTGYLYSNGGHGNGYARWADLPRNNSGDGSNANCSLQYDGAAGAFVIRNHYAPGSEVTPGINISDYTYTGSSVLINDGGGNWRIKFLTSGTFVYNGNSSLTIDVFTVGGGGKGTQCWSDVATGFGGGGGLTTTQSSIAVTKGASYSIVVGAGATTNGSSSIRGGTTSAFGVSAIGGQSGWYGGDGSGGSGGSDRGNAGGTNGSNGITVAWTLGTGQGTTTREFGESTGYLYSNGGHGNGHARWAEVPRTNSGDGSNANCSIQYDGAAGIVVIRNHR